MAEIDGIVSKAEAYPPLPDVLSAGTQHGSNDKPVLADGCYYLAYGSQEDTWFEGTLRVQSRSGQLFASGDLYAFDLTGSNGEPIGTIPPRRPGIPCFAIAAYAYYLRVTRIEVAEGGFALTFEAHRFLPYPKEVRKLDGSMLLQWVPEGSFTAQITSAPAPPGYPMSERFFVGNVVLQAGGPLGGMQIQIGWVSPFLRQAVVEIDRVPDAKVPLNNGADVTWQSVFRSFDWEVTPTVSDDDITKSDGPIWTDKHASDAMRAHRDSADLDAEWRYYVLVAEQIVAPGDAFGYMYHPRREALFMTSHHVFPEAEAHWGELRGKRFDTTVAFFRTVIHETGHAMGLDHNQRGFHFMRSTLAIAQEAADDMPFPDNIAWSFDPDDEQRLRHWPDIAVRPGGVASRGGGGLPLPQAQ